MGDYDTYTINDTGGGTAENELATLLAHTRSFHHYSCPRLGAAVDRVRTMVAGDTGHFRARRDLEGRGRTRGRASAKAAGNPPVVRTHPSDRCCSRRCSGLQRIRIGDQRFHREGWGLPLPPGESGFPCHHRIGHRVRSAPKGYIEGNRVLDGGNMVDYTQA